MVNFITKIIIIVDIIVINIGIICVNIIDYMFNFSSKN